MSDIFKAGEYIVTLINNGGCGKKNYCSKQRENHSCLMPVVDTVGNYTNGNSQFKAYDESGKYWRYATKEEAAEYERVGKPFDVTKMSHKPVEKLLTTIL